MNIQVISKNDSILIMLISYILEKSKNKLIPNNANMLQIRNIIVLNTKYSFSHNFNVFDNITIVGIAKITNIGIANRKGMFFI
jgi:hypothetical protein